VRFGQMDPRYALPRRLCEDQAIACEMLARECNRSDLSAEWMAMAAEWRVAANGPANEDGEVLQAPG